MPYSKLNISQEQYLPVLGTDTLSVYIPKSESNCKTIQILESSFDAKPRSVVIYVEEIHDVVRCLLTVLHHVENIILSEEFDKNTYAQTDEILDKSFTYQVRAEFDVTDKQFSIILWDIEDNETISIELHNLTGLSTALLNALSFFDGESIKQRTAAN